MPRYVAFLRAVNVGGRVVKMDALRRLFEKAGGSDVETVIASGNVIFASPSRSETALAARIAKTLESELGYAVPTILRTAAELRAAAARDPFPDSGRGDVFVGFLAAAPAAAAVRKLKSLETEDNEFRVVGRDVYWLCRGKFHESKFAAGLLEKTLGAPTTIRNVRTLRRMAERCAE